MNVLDVQEGKVLVLLDNEERCSKIVMSTTSAISQWIPTTMDRLSALKEQREGSLSRFAVFPRKRHVT
jgi:hypothetical protein